jgi:hypothetical protein
MTMPVNTGGWRRDETEKATQTNRPTNLFFLSRQPLFKRYTSPASKKARMLEIDGNKKVTLAKMLIKVKESREKSFGSHPYVSSLN